MDQIYTVGELLVLFKNVDAGMHHDLPDPSLQGSYILELSYLSEYLDESFLKHVLCILPMFCIAVAYRKHSGAEAPVKLLLADGIPSDASLYHCFFRHEIHLVSPNL
jgi:hypothetical protein